MREGDKVERKRIREGEHDREGKMKERKESWKGRS